MVSLSGFPAHDRGHALNTKQQVKHEDSNSETVQ